MKYFLRVLLVLVIAVVAVLATYSYFNDGIDLSLTDDSVETTVTKPAVTEKTGDKIMLANDSSKGIYLYKSGKKVILNYDSSQYEFDNWGKYIDLEEPSIYYGNFDEDDEFEIVIKAVDAKVKEGEYIYGIYYLDPVMKNGAVADFAVSYIDRNTWINITDNVLKEEVSQLKFSDKIVQFAIDYADVSIVYDEKSGIANGGYTGYFSAITDKNGKYSKLEKWSKGDGVFTITDDNKIVVDIPVNVKYQKLNDVQYAGDIHFELAKNRKGEIAVAPKSLVFKTRPEYTVITPTNYSAAGKWTYTEKNGDIIVDEKDTEIDWVKYETSVSTTYSTRTVSYANAGTDINNVSKLVISESGIKLIAKKDCTFSNAYKTGDYSVMYTSSDGDRYNIAYEAEWSKDEVNGYEVVTITFDRPYSRTELGKIQINYGAK